MNAQDARSTAKRHAFALPVTDKQLYLSWYSVKLRDSKRILWVGLSWGLRENSSGWPYKNLVSIHIDFG